MPGREQACGRSARLGQQGWGGIAGSSRWGLVGSFGGPRRWGSVAGPAGNRDPGSGTAGLGSSGARQATVAGLDPGRSWAETETAAGDTRVRPGASWADGPGDSWGHVRRGRPGG